MIWGTKVHLPWPWLHDMLQTTDGIAVNVNTKSPINPVSNSVRPSVRATGAGAGHSPTVAPMVSIWTRNGHQCCWYILYQRSLLMIQLLHNFWNIKAQSPQFIYCRNKKCKKATKLWIIDNFLRRNKNSFKWQLKDCHQSIKSYFISGKYSSFSNKYSLFMFLDCLEN